MELSFVSDDDVEDEAAPGWSDDIERHREIMCYYFMKVQCSTKIVEICITVIAKQSTKPIFLFEKRGERERALSGIPLQCI